MHTASSIGGVETWLDRACAHLSTRGFQPVVGLVRGMKYNSPDRYRRDHPALECLEVDGRGLNREGRVRALIRTIRSVQPDIVLPLGIVDANEAVIRRKLQGAQVRLLGRAQGNLPPMLADLRIYRDWFDAVVCPGKLTQRMLVEWAGFDPRRVLNISNGADEPVVQRRRAEPGPIRLGYVGRLSQPDKRVLDLPHICHELESLGVDYKLDIVGDGPARVQLEEKMRPFAPRVQMCGAKSHEQLYREVLPALDALIMTSASEAFGIVLVEAMMHGAVPVSSRYHGFHSEALVREGVTGLAFDVGDAAGAARAVQRLAESPSYLQELSSKAARHGREYTWQRSMERWEQVLHELADSSVVRASEQPSGLPVDQPGRLERLGFPPAAVDGLRRIRRALLGPAVNAGGEEWPLYHRVHSPEALESITATLERIDRPGPLHLSGATG
jgi:glycosyltransferase involved in cell wall biosynthesis